LLELNGYAVPDRPTSLTYHWAKHVLGDQQWTSSTTESMYFDDLRRAIRHPSSRLLVQTSRTNDNVAIIIAESIEIVPVERLGGRYGPELLVVYSADIGKILSGYMTTSSSGTTSIPETVWLRK
jgi:hypothetical protein